MARPVVHALLPAAGKGARFGGADLKQYLPIAGKPVLAHAIDAVNLSPEISGITVVIAAEDHMFADLIGTAYNNVETVPGGASRARSVLHGLIAIRESNPQAEWVLVHDAARPCLARSRVRRLLDKGLASRDGAILAVPVQDTLKRSDGDQRIAATTDRAGLWAAQTPQLFPLRVLAAAIEAMLERGETPTDEAAAMESIGARPLLVMGSPANIKITRPDDVMLAEAWFARREMTE